jgi:predicted deacylase
LGIFAGIHGDEPAGIFALMDFARLLDAEPELARDYRLSLYPLCNPGGYERGTRESPSGKDLNREFWMSSQEPEVILLENELRSTSFDGIISLHSDDTCGGFYGYARDRLISEQMLRPALAAAGAVIPCDVNPVIDGFEAVDGIIHAAYPGILTSPPERKPRPFEVILESPAHAPLSAQRDSMTRALRAILESYRSFIAYGGDL